MDKRCQKIAPWITGYIDREIPEDKINLVRQHLEECPDCYDNYLGELKVKQFLRERLPFVKAPKYLHQRVRRQLIRRGDRPSFWELIQSLFIYRPIAASFTVAVVVFLVIFPMYHSFIEKAKIETQTPIVAEVQGKIICLDCAFLSKTGEKFYHDANLHRPGLKSEDGSIWSFVNTPQTRELMKNGTFLNKKARIYGMLFKNSHYIYVKKYEIL